MEKDGFSVFFAEKLRDKNFTLDKLSESSGISSKNLESLLKGDYKSLPAAPYLRGYFMKIGEILDFDGEEAFKKWKDEAQEDVKMSGPQDKLPQNRFSRRPIAKYFWLGLLGVLMIFYLVLQLPRLLGLPEITISNPREPRIFYSEEKILVNGTVANANEIYVNGERIEIQGGSWQKEVALFDGLNTIEVTAKKFLGGEAKASREIIYEKPFETPVHATSTSTTTTEK
jgi:hypothetical protein